MGDSAEHFTGYSNLSLAQAVQVAQNSEEGIHESLAIFLEANLGQVWRQLQAKPNSYIFSPVEFALFNYHRSWFGDQDIVRDATKRYWDNYRT
jgi:hypothetical protein